MRQNNKQQHGKKKAKLQPKSKIKYRNLKSNYDQFEDDNFQLNSRSRRKERFIDYEDYEDDNVDSTSIKSKRSRNKKNVDDYITDDTDFDY